MRTGQETNLGTNFKVPLTLSAGGALLREVAGNASFRRLDVEAFLRLAPPAVTIAFRAMKSAQGCIALRHGQILRLFEVASLQAFRLQTSLRVSEGVTAGDLGGMPLEGFFTVQFDGAEIEALRQATGAASLGEAVGFAVWAWSRWHNLWREDYADHELGIYFERDGRFQPLQF